MPPGFMNEFRIVGIDNALAAFGQKPEELRLIISHAPVAEARKMRGADIKHKGDVRV